MEEIEELRAEVKRLKEKCDMQARVLMSLAPDRCPGVLFITGHLGTKDKNGLPEKILVCPAYGLDWAEIYTRTDTTTGVEW